MQGSVLHHQLEGAAEQEIPYEDRRLIAPHGIGGLTTPAQIARIDDIVVQQRRGMNKFDGCGERDVPSAAVSAEPGATEGEQRAQALATACDYVPGEPRNQRHRALHAIYD